MDDSEKKGDSEKNESAAETFIKNHLGISVKDLQLRLFYDCAAFLAISFTVNIAVNNTGSSSGVSSIEILKDFCEFLTAFIGLVIIILEIIKRKQP